MKNIINGIFISFGFLLMGLGILGVVIPVLPSTPFFILAGICFAKGSRRFHNWFLSTVFYKKYVEPAVHKKEMEKKAKTKTIVTLCIIFTVSFLLVPIWHAKVAIVLVALFHFYYFAVKIKTVKAEA